MPHAIDAIKLAVKTDARVAGANGPDDAVTNRLANERTNEFVIFEWLAADVARYYLERSVGH